MATSRPPLVNPSGDFNKFVQFSLLKDADAGMPTVYGIATLQQPDCDNELCHYETAVPAYQAWSKAAAKRTRGAGQEISLGNIRIQHGAEIGGKVTKIEYDDESKQIMVGSEPVNDAVLDMLRRGFLTGYSQAGSYLWRHCGKCDTPLPLQQGYNWCDKCNKLVAVMYGLKRIAEVSYVDSPATGEGFEHVKANGSTEIVKFQKKPNASGGMMKTKTINGIALTAKQFAVVGDENNPATWLLPIACADQDQAKKFIMRSLIVLKRKNNGIPAEALEKATVLVNAAATLTDVDPAEAASKHEKVLAIIKAAFSEALKARRGYSDEAIKGMWSVSSFAELLEGFANLYEVALWERDREGDDSEVPESLRETLESMIEAFILMATEEAQELVANKSTKNGNGDQNIMKTAEQLEQEKLELAKAQKALASSFAKTASFHISMSDAHKASASASIDLIAKLEADRAAEGISESQGAFIDNLIAYTKAASAAETAKSAAHTSYADQQMRLAEDADKDEARKVADAESDIRKSAAASLAKAAPEAPAQSDALTKAKAKVEATLLADPAFMEEVTKSVRESLLADLSKSGAAALKREQIVPTGVNASASAAALKHVARAGEKGGEAEDLSKFAAEPQEAITGPGF